MLLLKTTKKQPINPRRIKGSDGFLNIKSAKLSLKTKLLLFMILIGFTPIFLLGNYSDQLTKNMIQSLIKTADKEITLVIGQLYAVVNGEKIMIDVAPQIKEGRTVLPIAHIARILGMKVGFDAAVKEVTLSIE